MKTYRIGLIGYGRIGRHWARFFDDSARWELRCICDLAQERRAVAKEAHPKVEIVADDQVVFQRDDLNAVCLATTADARPAHIRQALAAGLHVVAEKPIASSIDEEESLLAEIEASDRLVAVNLFNRNAWYHKAAHEFIAAGEIGKLGIVRVCHLTAGRMPGQGHETEGPTFHDCGMHYVDVARWYAGSEYGRWDARGVAMWSEPEPWWVSVHGQFQNGVAFEITQGFVYGQMAKDTINNSYCELLGTKGVIRMRHDFVDTTLEMHGAARTVEKTASYGGKKFDVMIEKFTQSLDEGRNVDLPSARDSVIASRISQEMHDAAKAADPPNISPPDEMQEILRFKQTKA